jgi:hypothetical protein
VIGAAPVVLIRRSRCRQVTNPVVTWRPGTVPPCDPGDRGAAAEGSAARPGPERPVRAAAARRHQRSPVSTAPQNRSSKRTTRSNATRIAGLGPPGLTASSSPASEATQPANAGEDQLSTNGQ